MECVAYLRVSTERQAEEGNGLESQKRDIEGYARRNELIIDDWYVDDGYTGSNMNRPQLQRLINDCTAKRIKCVVAFKLDRLSRNMAEAIYIIEKIFLPNNVLFKCVHDRVSYDSPMEQVSTQMMAIISQYEKNTIVLRMRGGMLERVKKGYWRGGGNLPYCYSYSKEKGILVPIQERAEQARNALDLFLDGYSDNRIYKILGYSCEMTVKNILTSEVNIGMVPYKGKLYNGLHEPIFDKEKFYLAQEMRKTRRKNKSVPSPNLLTGLCYCGVCGCAMRYQKWSIKGHKICCCSRDASLNYLPNHNPNCNNTAEWAADIERQVEKTILEISLNISSKDKLRKQESKLSIMRKQLDREETKLKRLYELYSDGNDMVISMIKEKESEIADLKEKIRQESVIESNSPNNNIVYENIKKIADVWDNIDKEGKNRILKSIIKKIIIVNSDIEIVLNNF